MSIVTHACYLHLANLVDDATIVAIVEDGRDDEHRVEHADENILTAHECDESSWIVEHRPCVVP